MNRGQRNRRNMNPFNLSGSDFERQRASGMQDTKLVAGPKSAAWDRIAAMQKAEIDQSDENIHTAPGLSCEMATNWLVALSQKAVANSAQIAPGVAMRSPIELE